jgi:PAS domain S-box-containing protein
MPPRPDDPVIGPALEAAWRRLIPSAIIGLVLVATGALAWMIRSQEERQVHQVTDMEASRLEAALRREIGDRAASLQRMAARLALHPDPGVGGWPEDAALYLGRGLAFRRIVWIDASGRVRDSVTERGDASVPAARPDADPRLRRAIADARQRGRPVAARAIDYGGEGLRFFLCVPILNGGRFEGALVGFLQAGGLLAEILNEHLVPGYGVAVRGAGRELYAREATAGPYRVRWGVVRQVDLYGLSWALIVWPTPELLAISRPHGSLVVLVSGVLMSTLLGMALHLSRSVRRRAAQIESSHDRLQTLIAERQQVEEERDRFFKLSVDLLCIADTDGRFRRVNPAFERTLGFSTAELLSRPWIEFVHPDDRERSLREAEMLQQGRSTYNFENRYLCKDGSYRWLSWTIPAAAQGDPLLYAVARDVTERRRADERLQVAHDALEVRVQERTSELRRSNEELEQFAYVASHDLREPLRVIANFSELLARRHHGRLEPEAEEFMHFILDGVARMQALINDLLAYSRVGTRGCGFETAELGEICDQAIANLEPAIRESGARVTHDPLPTVQADRIQVLQLLQNLLSNALKFHGPAPPEIHVGAERQGAQWHLGVRDNGIGIERHHAERIFTIFQRLHGRDEYPGTGIGLSICKKIVERHGGRIWVDSRPGRGSTFVFTLPVVRPGTVQVHLDVPPPQRGTESRAS